MNERAILASRNEYIDQLNEMLISRFPGETRMILTFDSAEDDTNNYYPEDYLNTLTPNDLPPHRYVLTYLLIWDYIWSRLKETEQKLHNSTINR